MALVVGLTGGIASGKSTISNMFKDLGVEVIDADVEARLAVDIGKPAYEKIIDAFGTEILHEDRSLDRAKLGALIFHDSSKRKQLNSIVHPEVRRQMLVKKERAIRRGDKLVVLDIPLLFESGLTEMADVTLLVDVDEDVQLRRLMERNPFTKEEALARIHSQMPIAEKRARADFCINNNGTIEQSKKQLLQLLANWGISVNTI